MVVLTLDLRRALAALTFAACFGIGQGQTFTNAGFETGDFTGWTVAVTTNGQTAVQVVEPFDIDGGGLLPITNAARFSVGRIDTSTPTGGITITQNLDLVAGQEYTFRYMWASRNLGTSSNADGGRYSMIINGVTFNTQLTGSIGAGGLPGETGSFIYGFNTVNFTATSTGPHSVGAHVVRGFTPPTTLNQFLDNFSVQVVPEPATMAVFGIGVAAMFRKRAKKS